MSTGDDKPKIGLGYPIAQFFRALFGNKDAKASKWQRVIDGIASGALDIGSRVPVSGTPAWITLDVVHGGFATGGWAAAGPLEADEQQGRSARNLFYAGEEGRKELLDQLESGGFRIRFPEEGALPILAWLIDRGEAERAAQLLETILPFTDRIRFFPCAHEKPAPSGETVHVDTIGDVLDRLARMKSNPDVAVMNQTLSVWTPLLDRAVSLFLETVEGDPPSLRIDGDKKLVLDAKKQPITEGGWPGAHFTPAWTDRARAWIADFDRAGTPPKKRNLLRLAAYLRVAVARPLDVRELQGLRDVLAGHLHAHGAPSSEKRRATREMQARIAAQPPHDVFRAELKKRLDTYGKDEGLTDAAAAIAPVDGAPLPKSLIEKVERAAEDTVERLIQKGVIGSGEVLARVLPHLIGQVRAAGVEDPRLRRIYHAVYSAFRRRRGLLLLNLEHQVRLEELPWIKTIQPWLGDDTRVRSLAAESLHQVARLNFEAFPETITPNKLVRELRSLSAAADLKLPFTDELAADIFMGAFSGTFLEAAKVAARLLDGSLYARYYALPIARILSLDDLEKKYATTSSPGFFAICRERAGGGDQQQRWSPAANGTIIEQAQILTTHNLAVLFRAFPLAKELPLRSLAERCFKLVTHELTRRNPTSRDPATVNPATHLRSLPLAARSASWKNQLQSVKNSAYAWRQMIFFLSFAAPSESDTFLRWASEHLDAQPEGLKERFTPAMEALKRAAIGETLGPQDRRFFGWTVGRHWIFPPRTDRV